MPPKLVKACPRSVAPNARWCSTSAFPVVGSIGCVPWALVLDLGVSSPWKPRVRHMREGARPRRFQSLEVLGASHARGRSVWSSPVVRSFGCVPCARALDPVVSSGSKFWMRAVRAGARPLRFQSVEVLGACHARWCSTSAFPVVGGIGCVPCALVLQLCERWRLSRHIQLCAVLSRSAAILYSMNQKKPGECRTHPL